MRRRCLYVIMPARSDPDAKHRRRTIEMECDPYGVEPIFPMDRLVPMGEADFMVGSALEELEECELVLVDFTFERPSCYYELGLAEALGRQIFAVAKSGTPIHQTAHRSRVHFFDSDDEYQRLIAEALAAVFGSDI